MKKIKFISLILFSLAFTLISCGQEQDRIVGKWKVDNEFNKAVYEIVEVNNTFYAKIHSYKDSKKSYTGKNTKEDYFITDVKKIEKGYSSGKLYTDKDTFYKVFLSFKNTDELEVKMTIDNYPYKELWTRIK